MMLEALLQHRPLRALLLRCPATWVLGQFRGARSACNSPRQHSFPLLAGALDLCTAVCVWGDWLRWSLQFNSVSAVQCRSLHVASAPLLHCVGPRACYQPSPRWRPLLHSCCCMEQGAGWGVHCPGCTDLLPITYGSVSVCHDLVGGPCAGSRAMLGLMGQSPLTHSTALVWAALRCSKAKQCTEKYVA